jgi:O-antigen/teichoic acid export membrane protein
MIDNIKSILSLPNFIKYFKNTSWLFLESFITSVIAIFISIYVAKYLGPKQLGVLTFAISIAVILRPFVKLGLESIAYRDLISYKEKTNEILSSTFWPVLICGIFIYVSLIIVCIFFDFSNEEIYTILTVSTVLLFEAFTILKTFFHSRVNAKLTSISRLVSVLIISSIKIILIYFGASLYYFALVYSLDFLITIVLYIVFFKWKYDFSFINNFSKSRASSQLSNSWPLLLSSISTNMNFKINYLMIGSMLGSYDLGLYSVGVKIPEALNVVPMLIASSLFPAIINIKKKSNYDYQNRLKQFYFFTTWIGLILTFLLIFFSESIIGLFGPEYTESKNILVYYAVLVFFNFQWIARGRWVIAENLQKKYFLFILSGVPILVILNFIFIPKYGIQGSLYSIYIITNFDKKFRFSNLMLIKSIFNFK